MQSFKEFMNIMFHIIVVICITGMFGYLTYLVSKPSTTIINIPPKSIVLPPVSVPISLPYDVPLPDYRNMEYEVVKPCTLPISKLVKPVSVRF